MFSHLTTFVSKRCLSVKMIRIVFWVHNWNPMKFLLPGFLLFFASSLKAQTYLGFEYAPDVVVKIGSDTLEHAWAGGLNFAQFSDIDIDYDGDMDLFVFDRSGNEIAVFVTDEVNGSPVYRYLYNGASLFPPDLRYRAALVDYDQDGKNDLFCYGTGGMTVYKNVGNAGTGLQWQLFKQNLESNYIGDYNNLYIANSDIPALVDVEGDGDLDVLTFHIGGERLEYHQNQSMELYGIPDSLEFVLQNECWGHFREDPNSSTVILNDTQSPCGVGNGNIPDPLRDAPAKETDSAFVELNRHAGSTLLALDMNNNDVLDLVLGDVASPNLVLLMNGGSAPNTNSAMVSQDINFPSNTTPATIQLFPASFYVDVNHDNVKDLIVGANARTISQNEASVTYYENLGQNNQPNFFFRTKSFLQEEMIEHGLGSIPVMFDQNGDGKRDLLVSNFFRYKPTLNKECAFLVYRNTGTASEPQFSYLDDDFLSLTTQSFGLRSIPTFGDLDNDGDEDLIIGMENGMVNRYTNTAGAGNNVAFGPAAPLNDNNGVQISVTAYAAPQLFDLDDDGLLDLVVGNKTGEIAYYRNTGTASNAVFTLIDDTLGDVDVAATPDGYAIPHFFRVNDTTHLFLGAYDGRLHYYDDIDGHLDPGSSFNLVSAAYRGIDVGLYSSFWVEDIDGDGLLNLFVGQDLGGLHHMEADPLSTASLDETNAEPQQWLLAPNPAKEEVTIYAFGHSKQAQVAVYSMLGELVLETTVQGTSSLDISGFGKGMYVVTLVTDNRRETLRLVKE
jgi:Secretion system C-terminal sorting domain/FG-GAP-like repeat